MVLAVRGFTVPWSMVIGLRCVVEVCRQRMGSGKERKKGAKYTLRKKSNTINYIVRRQKSEMRRSGGPLTVTLYSYGLVLYRRKRTRRTRIPYYSFSGYHMRGVLSPHAGVLSLPVPR